MPGWPTAAPQCTTSRGTFPGSSCCRPATPPRPGGSRPPREVVFGDPPYRVLEPAVDPAPAGGRLRLRRRLQPGADLELRDHVDAAGHASPVALGSAFRQVRSIPAVAEEEFAVTEWEQGRRVAITGDFGPFSGTLCYRVEPAQAGTLLTNDVELSPLGVLGVVGKIAGPRLKTAIAQNLEVLRSRLESG